VRNQYFSALRMSESLSLLAMTRSILAAGAMACADSTSSAISPDQLTSSALVGSNVGSIGVDDVEVRGRKPERAVLDASLGNRRVAEGVDNDNGLSGAS